MRRFSVISNEHIASNVICLTLKKIDARPFSFVAGQYAAISFYHHGRPTPSRCFSIASSPVNPDIIKFGIRIGGKYTHAIQKLKTDDLVDVRGPFGNFVISPEQQKIVMLAGGIGITPFLSQLCNIADRKLETPVTLLYSCRNDSDVAFSQELLEIRNNNPNIKMKFVVSEIITGKISPEFVAHGKISSEIITTSILNDYKNSTFYMCGPPGFMESTKSLLLDKNVHPSQIISEAFNQVADDRTEATRNWPKSIYVFTAMGLAMGSIAVMTLDLIKTLPPKDLIEETKGVEKSPTTNLRQNDIDALVNDLPITTNPAPMSPGSIVSAETAKSNNASNQSSQTTTSGQSPTSASPSTSAPVTAPKQSAPAPTPAPVTCGSKC